jgi:3-oxoacyl-[acyl-carrier-protein] synthase II
MNDGILITGIGVVSSIGIGKEQFRCGLRTGADGISEISEFDTSPFKAKKGGVVKNFNVREFIPISRIRRLDRASQLAIAASKLALEDAKFSITNSNCCGIGIILGSGFCGLANSEGFHRGQVLGGFLEMNPMLFPNTVPNAATGNVSIELGIKGVNSTVVQSYCTAEVAMIMACDLLADGRAEAILTGGVDELSEILFSSYSALNLLSFDHGEREMSRPYDLKRNGIVLGEGAAILVLERERHALSRGAKSCGRILGYSVVGGSDADSPWRDIERAIHLAVESMPGEGKIDYISGAGNSSKKVDEMEAGAIRGAFPSDYHIVPISSIKSLIGESIASGGMRMAANTIILEEGFIPPTIHYKTPDPRCDLNYVVNRPVEREVKTILHNGISPDGTYASILLGR